MEEKDMKKYMIAFAALAMVLSCAKENPVQENSVKEDPQGTVVSFTATIPELTKASVNAATFAWEAGDQIAIPADGISGGYAIFTNSAGKLNTFTYTLKEGEKLKAGKAKYPATTPGTSFDSPAAAKKAFQMEADYALGKSSLTFTHKSALVHLSFSNVPSFATSIVVNDGTSDVATITLSGLSDGTTVNADVPITPNGAKTYSFKLMENSNELISKSKAATLAAGTYYSTPEIAVGGFFKFNDETYNKAKYIKLLSNSAEELAWSELKGSGSAKYFMYSPGNGDQITIQLFTEDTGAGAFTSTKIFFYKKFYTFSVGASTLPSSDYRIYIERNQTGSSIFNYDVCWAFLENKDNSSDQPLGTWGGTQMTKLTNNIFYVDIPSAAYSNKYYLSAHVNQNTTGDWHPKTYDNERLKITTNRDIKTTIYAWDNGYNLSFGNTWDTSWDWQ